MKKLYIALFLLPFIFIFWYVTFGNAVETNHSDKFFEYGRVRLNEYNYNIRWETGTHFFVSNSSATGSNDLKYASNCQNLLLQLGADFDKTGQVRNIVGVFDFLGNQGWELTTLVKDSNDTIYIFKREY